MLSWDESSIYHAERKVTAVRFSKWHIAPEKPEAQACLRAAGYPYLVAAVLSARGIETPEQAAAFLEREDKLTISPFLMRDMDKAAARVQQAIANGERIAVFGDYDVDGITATCILVDYLKSRGADVVHYIPRRIEDGYGLSRDAIKGLFDQGVRLLVTVDCGITGVEEVDYANSLGLDVVITDHHECREVLPRAVAVVDPHRADCAYPFKHLAGCGVALKLVLALGGPDREEPLFARYCTLAAGFTIDRDNIPAFRDRMNEYARSYCGGQQPESALEIDVAIAHPAAVTLEELEALSVLEPYGSGNARPLFCLLGATLLRTQNVGQNRHLKLRLGKGCAQFDGIFFSTVAERCGCHPGDRVDAAFYLQINEFRGSRTVQLQMVDIRPSLCASGREQEALTLAHRCAAGKAVSLREARRALPTREQFAAAWRFLDRTVPEDGLTTDRLPLLRLMAAELGGAEPVLRAAMCAAVFRERGLLDWQLNGDAITLHLRRGQHVALDQSPLMNTLQNDNEKGGGAL